MVGRQLPIFSLIVPFWLIWAMAGRKKMVEVWPACLTAGLSFAITQFVVSNFFGPSLVDIIGSLVSMARHRHPAEVLEAQDHLALRA